MKKLIIVLAVVATVGFIAIQVSACMWDGHYGGGAMRGYWGGNDPKGGTYQEFLNETTQLRQDLAAKRGEYSALMAQPTPDSQRAAELSREIIAINDSLQTNAQAKGYSLPGRRGGHGHSQMAPWGYCDSRQGWGCW